jgi:hypothetical protein
VPYTGETSAYNSSPRTVRQCRRGNTAERTQHCRIALGAEVAQTVIVVIRDVHDPQHARAAGLDYVALPRGWSMSGAAALRGSWTRGWQSVKRLPEPPRALADREGAGNGATATAPALHPTVVDSGGLAVDWRNRSIGAKCVVTAPGVSASLARPDRMSSLFCRGSAGRST